MKLPDDLIKRLTQKAKYKSFWSEPDKQQFFWLGVVEASTRAREFKSEDFLFLSGCNRVRNENSREWSYKLERICEICGHRYGYRGKTMCCGCPTITRRRMVEFQDHKVHELDQTMMITIEQFVASISGGIKKKIAQRYLVDRWDVLYENYNRKIADEIGVSPQAVNRWVKIIRDDLRSWLV